MSSVNRAGAERPPSERRARRGALLVGAVSALALAAPGVASASTNVTIGSDTVIVDPSVGTPNEVQVTRGGTLLATTGAGKLFAVPAPGTGFSVNHDGAPSDCFAGVTPDISAGDTVTTRDAKGVLETMVVQDIAYTATVSGASTTITGHARDPFTGAALPGPLDVAMGGQGVKARDKNVAIDAAGNFSVTLANTDVSSITVAWADPAAVDPNIATTTADAEIPAAAGCPAVARAGMNALASSTVNLANVDSGLAVSGVGSPSPSASTVNLRLGGLAFNAAASLTGAPNQAWSFTIPAADLRALPDGTHALTANFAPAPFAVAPSQSVTVDLHAPAAPSASVPAGTYADTQSVSLGSEPGAAIFVTTDGTTPTTASPRLTGALVVDASQTVKAIAVDAAGNPSDVATFGFTINRPAQVTQGTPAPAAAQTGAAAGGAVAGAAGNAAAGAQQKAAAAAGLSVSNVSLAQRRISRARLRKQGLRVSMRLPAGTRVVRIAVFRARNGRAVGKALATVFRSRSISGTYRVTLRDAALLRRLTPGSYVVTVAAGRSRATLGTARSVTLRVLR